jgi:hypothetical protein
MSEHGHAAHHSADDEYAFTPDGSSYEHTDAHTWIIVKFLFWLAISALIIHLGLGFFYEALIRRSMEIGEQRYPLAAAQEERLPPAPRLQQFPATEFYEFRLGEQDLLDSYGWMNREAGVVHIPVNDAMRLLVQRGLPVAPQAAEPAAAGDQMPSDSSAGRVMERRR